MPKRFHARNERGRGRLFESLRFPKPALVRKTHCKRPLGRESLSRFPHGRGGPSTPPATHQRGQMMEQQMQNPRPRQTQSRTLVSGRRRATHVRRVVVVSCRRRVGLWCRSRPADPGMHRASAETRPAGRLHWRDNAGVRSPWPG